MPLVAPLTDRRGGGDTHRMGLRGALVCVAIAASIAGGGCGLDETPERIEGSESHEFEPDDLERARDASERVEEHLRRREVRGSLPRVHLTRDRGGRSVDNGVSASRATILRVAEVHVRLSGTEVRSLCAMFSRGTHTAHRRRIANGDDGVR